MGHHLGSKTSLVPLIDRLNKYPVGLVDSEILREILSLLFDPQEAYIASQFPLEEATLEELVKRTRLPAEELRPALERMAEKGLVMDLPYGDQSYYLLMPGLIGFFEFTFMKQRTDLPMQKIAQLMQDYMHQNPRQGMAKEFFGSSTQLTRSLVYEEHIPVSSQITTYESAREIIQQAGYGALGMCYCRHKKQHLDQTCSKEAPMEGSCISLGAGAKFLVRRGFAEEKSVDELLAVLERARELNLTHVTDNIRHKPSFICNCCSCCCELLAGVRAGYPDGIAKTPFLAVVDAERCNGCGLCLNACNVEGIVRQGGGEGKPAPARVEAGICLGCGACVPACKRRALSLQERPERPQPPHKRKDLYYRLLKEKGRLRPYMLNQTVKTLKGLFRRSSEG